MYRVLYYKKIRKFYEGAENPRKFNSFKFKEGDIGFTQ
jgi:hypothetical protein